MAMEAWLLAFVSISTAIVFLAFLVLILIYLTTSPYPELECFDSERSYCDPNDGNQMKLFSSLRSSATLDLSVIIPAYNESTRLPLMLNDTLSYLENRSNLAPKFTYEVIIVDDGSSDKTTQIGWEYSSKYSTNKVRVMTLTKNRGKGAAVRMGMLVARGRLLLFADADGATKFSDVDKLEEPIKRMSKRPDSLSVICGSRAHLEEASIAKRSVFRTLLMYGFHFAVWSLCVGNLKDTQCGFKMFTRSAARLLFQNMHVERWAFDVDILYLANHFRIPILEVPVNWHEVDGSKLVPIFSWIQMAKDLILIRLRYALGAWKIEPLHKLDFPE